ncbi:Potassium-transporting ATPase C chain [compost metagenome]
MKIISVTLRTSLLLMVLVLAYQLAVTGIAQAIAPDKANGSIIYNRDGQAVGSSLIGQSFTSPTFFQGRVSSIDYNAASSGTPNYSPSNTDMLTRTSDSITKWKVDNPEVPISNLPIDLISNSGSGLDPHISPDAALIQIPRISELTGIAKEQLEKLVDEHTEGPDWGLFGDKRVNVLQLNIALSEMNK